eukprot:769505-Pelagomonas_calceolata.AAC.1
MMATQCGTHKHTHIHKRADAHTHIYTHACDIDGHAQCACLAHSPDTLTHPQWYPRGTRRDGHRCHRTTQTGHSASVRTSEHTGHSASVRTSEHTGQSASTHTIEHTGQSATCTPWSARPGQQVKAVMVKSSTPSQS